MLITGTRNSIGKYLAQYYVEKGFLVVGCSRGNIDYKLKNYHHFCLNLTDEPLVKKMFSEIRKKYGRLDVLINNAGISSKNHVLLTPLTEVNDVLNTNFVGTYLFCREAVKLMKRKKFGRIINISSVHVPLALVGTSIYGASKAAVEQFSKVLAKETFDFGVTVNSLSLSVVKNTGMENALTDKLKNEILNQTISKVQLSFHDVTNAINFFISEESEKLTNQVLCLGGV